MSKIIFFNIGWMDFYNGIRGDTITGGGRHVDTLGWGGEMYNFREFKGRYYGYVQIGGLLNLLRLDVDYPDDIVKNVIVVWTAKEPENGGTYIIGWYKNATLYRAYQEPPTGSKREWKEHMLGYFATAKVGDCKLLSRDERIVRIPRGKNGMGQRNVWYAENSPDYIKVVMDYILNGIIPQPKRQPKGGARSNDPLKRLEVETKAVKCVISHYRKMKYEVKSVEKDNVGWDLTVTNGDIELKLEVKGLSGSDVSTELTPNEFRNLRLDLHNYRICIVTSALSNPLLRIFRYSKDYNVWISNDRTRLEFEEVISARIFSS